MSIDSKTREACARWLLADLLLWHKREARPEWWVYFERILNYDTQQFLEDADCLGGVELIGEVGQIDRSIVWRFSFPSDQDYKIKVGDEVLDPATAREVVFSGPADGEVKFPVPKKVGEVVAIDEANGTLDIKRGKIQGPPTATVFVPAIQPNPQVINSAIQRLAQVVIDDQTNSNNTLFSGARALLGRKETKFRSGSTLKPKPSESASQRFIRLAPLLDNSYLVVQGPPGSGKTWALARAVVECVKAGQKVGLCAFKHETIITMVNAIVEACAEPSFITRLHATSTNLKIIRKVATAKDLSAGLSGIVSQTSNNSDVDKAILSGTHQVAAGTAWLFTREEMPELDVIFIDEAGQMSLANAVAVATSAKSVVLVGDPQQLAQPGKGAHPLMPEVASELFPYGSVASALQHVLNNHETIPDDEGIFLDTTQRLHPDICRFVSEAMYSGRLKNSGHCGNRSIIMSDGSHEAGIRWCPVEHEGNKMYASEEVDAIIKIVAQFVGAARTNRNGEVRQLTPADIMVVAPYNSQVNDLRVALPDCQVGTVDKFQGLEAPIVIVSLTASSSEDVPRGMEFLYSTNRLNVAVSRAKTLCIVVGNSRLLAARCNSVRQLQLVNVLCRYVEMAKTWKFSNG